MSHFPDGSFALQRSRNHWPSSFGRRQTKASPPNPSPYRPGFLSLPGGALVYGLGAFPSKSAGFSTPQ